MKKFFLFLLPGIVAAILLFIVSCSDNSKSNTLAPTSDIAASELQSLETRVQNYDGFTEDQLVDSLYAEMVSRLEAKGKSYDPEMVLMTVRYQAHAILGEDIYLSKYEVSELPKERDPDFGYSELTTPQGTFYFVMPHCLCGHVMPEERYFGHESAIQMLTCGCLDY